jgi:hypothetical protein
LRYTGESKPDEEAIMALAPNRADTVRFLEDEESRAFFDAQAHRLMGMSGAEFLRRYDAGEFAEHLDHPDHRGLTQLVMLIPFGR